MSNNIIVIELGEHEGADQFAEYLLGEVAYLIDNEDEHVGVPVLYGNFTPQQMKERAQKLLDDRANAEWTGWLS